MDRSASEHGLGEDLGGADPLGEGGRLVVHDHLVGVGVLHERLELAAPLLPGFLVVPVDPAVARRIEMAVRELPRSVDSALDGLDQYLDRVPEKIEARSEEIEAWATRLILGFVENLNVYDMVVSNMREYDERQLERLMERKREAEG